MPADTAFLQKTALRQTRDSDIRSARDCATVITAAEPAGLAAIHRSSVNLALWIRRLPAALADDAAWTAAEPFSSEHRIEIGPINMRRRITPFLDAAGLPPRPSRPLLASDMARLVRLFAALSGFSQINLRLELLDHDACRLFHCDRKSLRLLCTYYGPGTEWLPEDAVDRRALGGGCNRAICRDPKRIQRLAAGTVGLFKGEAHPGNAGRGIVHRSPPIAREGLRRLVLCLDGAG
jgi:hypothetical protein